MDEILCFRCFVLIDCRTYLGKKRFDTFLAWFDDESAFVLSDVETEKVKTLINVRNQCLLALSARNSLTMGMILFSRSSFDFPDTTKSSAYVTKL